MSFRFAFKTSFGHLQDALARCLACLSKASLRHVVDAFLPTGEVKYKVLQARKGEGSCSFLRARSNRNLGKVLLVNFASTWNNLLKNCLSPKFLLREGYVSGTLRKELPISPFVEHFKTTTLGDSQ